MDGLDEMIKMVNDKSGFTLIELSIVLVIIGLIIGGVLVGQDLIQSAAIRSTIAQIGKYNTAVRAFQNKYGYYPGDIPDPLASNSGLSARGVYSGEGDGDGVIKGTSAGGANNNCGFCVQSGETVMVWVDLATAGLIDGGFNTATLQSGQYFPSQINPALYFPAAKIGNNNYIYIFSGGLTGNGNALISDDSVWFGMSATTAIVTGSWQFSSSPGLTVAQAYNIDQKIDDGLPQSGRVLAIYYNNAATYGSNYQYHPTWAASGAAGADVWGGGGVGYIATTTATAYASTNCYDNNGVAGTQQYSTAKNATSVNCALSFKMQ